MKAQRGSWAPEKGIDTPYRKAQQEWDLRLGATTLQALNWRRATFGALGALLLALVGLIYLGALPKVEPYLVQVDKIGAPTCLGALERSAQTAPPPAAIQYHLRRFLTDVRSLSSDPAIAKANFLDAYKLVTPAAANQLSAWLRDHNPLTRVGAERISVEVAGILPLSANTWQSDWTETSWDEAGSMKSQTVWRASIRVVFRVPQTAADVVANPIGLFVDEFHWAELRINEPKAP